MQQVLQAMCCTPGRAKPQVVLVGATLGPSIESSALQMVRGQLACCDLCWAPLCRAPTCRWLAAGRCVVIKPCLAWLCVR